MSGGVNRSCYVAAANSRSYLRLPLSSFSYQIIFKSGNFHCNCSIENAFTRGNFLLLVLGSQGKVKSSSCLQFKIIHMPPKHILGDIDGPSLTFLVQIFLLYAIPSRRPFSANKKLNKEGGRRKRGFFFLPTCLKITHCFSWCG